MRTTRLLLACSIAACLAAPLASPALADEEVDCPPGWGSDFVLDLLGPPLPAGELVELGEETIAIRGDRAATWTVEVADFYRVRTEEFLACLEQAVGNTVTPYQECLAAASGPILTSPDPVARYVEAGTDLVVKVHYARAVEDVRLIFNCNGIVTYGDPPA